MLVIPSIGDLVEARFDAARQVLDLHLASGAIRQLDKLPGSARAMIASGKAFLVEVDPAGNPLAEYTIEP